MKIKSVILSALCFIILFPQGVTANHETWKKYMAEFLINNYPSLFDEAAIARNETEYQKYVDGWNTDNLLTAADLNFSSDIFLYNTRLRPDDSRDIVMSLIMPRRYHFYDLDFDGIPEIIIDLSSDNSGWGWRNVYKLYGSAYEYIGTLSGGEYYEFLYINPDNKIISVQRDRTQVFEIRNKEIVYSEYIDSLGIGTFDGVKYSEIGTYTHDFFSYKSHEAFLAAEVFLADLRYIPECDCSDVLNMIKYPNNPKTGDNFFILFAGSAASLAVIKFNRKYRRLGKKK